MPDVRSAADGQQILPSARHTVGPGDSVANEPEAAIFSFSLVKRTHRLISARNIEYNSEVARSTT